MNGPAEGQGKYIDRIDPDDPEYVRQLRRPAEVKEDMRQMEDRSRVNVILKSQAFREELEEIVADQLKSGPHPASLLALQQISELFLPQARGGGSGSISKVGASAIPISDIRGVDSLNYSKPEKSLRCKVASAYRLADIFGWSKGFTTCITARISQDYEHFLLAPYGMFHNEVTASALLRVSLQGEVLDQGCTTLGICRNTFSLHAAVHASRPDLKVLIYIRSANAVAVSAMNCGLIPISQEAIAVGEISCYGYSGNVGDQEERDKLSRALGPSNRVLLLRNFGVLVGGDSIEDAFHTASNFMTAADIQIRCLPAGLDNLQLPSEETRKKAQEVANQVPQAEEGGRRKWRRGEMEFEAYMRNLDNAGYRTGHNYHEPIMRRGDRRDRVNSDVEIPPSSSSMAYYDDKTQSPLKSHLDKQKKAFKSEWLNTPNSYKKEEFDEKGTPNPKKITRWVSEGDDKSCTPVKVENPNQFAPQGDNPKEFRQKHEAIRKEYYTDKIDAGPQSRILEGMSWEEAQRIKDGHVSGTSDSMIVVGAASKGIIQRDHQHNAVVYKTYYAPNPFDSMSPEEMEQYKKEVQGEKAEEEGQGDVADESALEPAPEGRLISSEERMQQVRQDQDGETTITTTKTTTITVDTEEANIDLQRSQSARLPPDHSKQIVDELQKTNFGRSKSERKQQRGTLNGDQQPAGSPTKSTSSGEGTLEEPGSPSHEAAVEQGSPSKEGKKKKKRGFRIPSFSKKKEKE